MTMSRGSGELTTGLAANLEMTIASNAAPGLIILGGNMVAVGFGGTDLDRYLLQVFGENEFKVCVHGPTINGI